MEEFHNHILLIASRVLSYPEKEDIENVIESIESLDAKKEIKQAVRDAVTTVYRIPYTELTKIYVETFDLKAEVGLYLSAHEFGDSPKRGAALIKLQKIINEAGFERDDAELADYIPMLYEFVAIVGENKNKERLIKRLACVTQRILNHLPDKNPYYPIFSLLMKYVFEPPTTEELTQMDQDREQADLEELPYPILYN